MKAETEGILTSMLVEILLKQLRPRMIRVIATGRPPMSSESQETVVDQLEDYMRGLLQVIEEAVLNHVAAPLPGEDPE